jgi:isocitrate dehydrogenase
MMESSQADERLVGIDLFVESNQQPSALAESIQALLSSRHRLTLISNRGTQVWPSGSVFTDCVNQYRVRIEVSTDAPASRLEMLSLATQLSEHIAICSIEMLMNFDGAPAYSLAQGQ